ncbi:MAG: hypothetical protein M1813_004760 [Trichoglossum hirsutum]|nr:MAG: hypothetical protein M1813_004760 [Trichoglossum hirsutum]
MRPTCALAIVLSYYATPTLAGRCCSNPDKPAQKTLCNILPDDSIPGTGTANLIALPPNNTVSTNGIATASRVRRQNPNVAGTITYDPSCSSPVPTNSGYSGHNNLFPTMGDVISRAYNEALTLANAGLSLGATDPPFTHYFIGTQQLNSLHAMFGAIVGTSPVFSVNFVCTNDPNECTNAVAVTDASPSTGPNDVKQITICDSFWTYISTRFLLYDQSQGLNPGVPFRDNTAGGWCPPAYTNVNFLGTAGHTILHELTHLDALGGIVGLDPDNIGSRGTSDVQQDCELNGARNYLVDYIADPTLSSPDYNAESYAAAATEKYFTDLCGRAIP